MSQKPIIFLDVDGVLNSTASCIVFGDYDTFNPISCGLLTRLVVQADANIVVSSSWRIGRTVEDLQRDLGAGGGKGFVDRIIDRTGDEPGVRGNQIKAWIDRNNFQGRYVILDDDSDMLEEQRPRFVKTRHTDGFGLSEYRKALMLLKPDHPETRVWVSAEEQRMGLMALEAR